MKITFFHHFVNSLKKELKHNTFDYLILLTASVFFLISLSFFSYSRLTMFIVILLFASFYIIWGALHHSLKKDLYLKNLLEYILIGFLALILIKTLFFP